MECRRSSNRVQPQADHRNGLRAGGGLWIAVWHPFVSGRLSRWQRIEQMIEEMQATGEVWFATLEEIATHCKTLDAAGTPQLRRQVLPHYGGVSPLPDRLPSSMPDSDEKETS